MNENTRIEEMARVMCGNREKSCLLCPIQSPCLMRNCAELLNAEGYCKASEVAREIFAEISKLIAVDKNGEATLDVRELYKLEKKYLEVDENAER